MTGHQRRQAADDGPVFFRLPKCPPSPVPPTLEDWRIDELREILGQARFDTLVRVLIDDCRDRPRRLSASAERHDLIALRAEAHGRAGAAASIGASALGQGRSSSRPSKPPPKPCARRAS
jgi:hypothetical protein